MSMMRTLALWAGTVAVVGLGLGCATDENGVRFICER